MKSNPSTSNTAAKQRARHALNCEVSIDASSIELLRLDPSLVAGTSDCGAISPLHDQPARQRRSPALGTQ